MLIFHREPALILAFLASVVSLASTYLLGWSDLQQGLVNALAVALVGLLTAWSVKKDALAAAILGVAGAVIELAVSFGAHISSADQAILTSVVATGVAMFLRPVVTTRAA